MKAICTIKKKKAVYWFKHQCVAIAKVFSSSVHQTGRRNTGIYYHNKKAPIKEIINGIVPNAKQPITPQKAGRGGGGCCVLIMIIRNILPGFVWWRSAGAVRRFRFRPPVVWYSGLYSCTLVEKKSSHETHQQNEHKVQKGVLLWLQEGALQDHLTHWQDGLSGCVFGIIDKLKKWSCSQSDVF